MKSTHLPSLLRKIGIKKSARRQFVQRDEVIEDFPLPYFLPMVLM